MVNEYRRSVRTGVFVAVNTRNVVVPVRGNSPGNSAQVVVGRVAAVPR